MTDSEVDASARDYYAAIADDKPVPRKKRSKGKSPMAMTLEELRKRGWTAQVVERRMPRTFTTVDLFGVIDLVAIVPQAAVGYASGGAILGIQATTGPHHANRRSKILAEPRAKEWVEAGGRLEIWTWSKRVALRKDGTKAKLPKWTLRVETYAEMLAGQSAE
jgi:hypothetical protein